MRSILLKGWEGKGIKKLRPFENPYSCFLSSFLCVFKDTAQQKCIVMEKRLYKHAEFLTTLKPPRNYENFGSLNKAADYIFSTLKKLKCKVEVQNFKANGSDYKNVIGSFGPSSAPRIIVGAHYDVAGDQPGADDNASAVAGLLELARLTNEKNDLLKYRIDFVAYSLEEPPFFATDQMGSAIHARSLYDNNVKVEAMICLEMIGYFSDKAGSQGFPNSELSKLYPNTGNFILVVGKNGQEQFTQKVKGLMMKNCEVDVQSITLEETNYLGGLSDHRNYWQYGYNAVMINDTSFLRNPHYHQNTDTIDTLDFSKMAEVVKGVFGVLINL